MKTSLRYIFCALALSLTALTGNLTSSTFAADAEKNTDVKAAHDHIKMKEGKLWTVKNGEKAAVTETVTLDNGTKVMTDGSVVMKDGEKAMLSNGDSISMDGKIMKAEAKKDAKDAAKDAGAASSPTTIEEAGKRPTESAPKSN